MASNSFLHRMLDPTPYYPTLAERVPIGYIHRYLPWAVSIGAQYLGHGPITTAVAFSLLLTFLLQRPFYTTGGNFGDYACTALDLWLITRLVDFYFHPPRYLGRPGSETYKKGGVAHADLKTWQEKLVWALRLQFTPRGVGWDWEVKGIIENHDAKLTRAQFLTKRFVCLVYHFVMQDLAVYGVEFCWTVQPTLESAAAKNACWFAICWFGGMTLYQGFGIWDNGVSAMTVLLGLCETWEWPPILGTLESSWSVRQFWGESYHQMLRRVDFPNSRPQAQRAPRTEARHAGLALPAALCRLRAQQRAAPLGALQLRAARERGVPLLHAAGRGDHYRGLPPVGVGRRGGPQGAALAGPEAVRAPRRLRLDHRRLHLHHGALRAADALHRHPRIRNARRTRRPSAGPETRHGLYLWMNVNPRL
ncbi:hypothetical protein F4775DRAFT_582596 [Biscogniauxia sp. FL1348]|nr:hypothetical protein F4775DRAFT_582596 [Biscogniauxia sp. FL1348]